MKSLKIFLCLTVLTVTFACDRAREVSARLDKIDTLMREDPDSALVLLDSMRVGEDEWSEPLRMRYELLRADAQNKAYVDFTTDSVMKVVADYYDEHGTPNDQMRAHYLLGCTYRDLKDAPMELQCFQDAVEKADTASKDCDLYTLVSIYGQMADIYHNQYLPEEELKALSMCEKIAYMDNDLITTTKAYELRLRAYDSIGMTDSVESISLKAFSKFMSLGDTVRAAQLLNPYIQLLIDRKDYSKVQTYMDFFEERSGYYNDISDVLPMAHMYLYSKGSYLLYEGDYGSAIKCFRELLKYGKSEAAYKGLLAVYDQKNQLDSVGKYAKLYASANDSSFVHTNSRTIEQMTSMYDYARHQRIAEQKSSEAARIRAYNTKLILFLVILVLVMLVSWYIYKDVLRRKQMENDNLLMRFNKAYEQLEQTIADKENFEVLYNASENKNSVYIEKIKDYQDRIDMLASRIEAYKSIDVDVEFNAWMHKFLDTDIVYCFIDHARNRKPRYSTEAGERDWKELNHHFCENAKSFYIRITSEEYKLVESDLRVIMLMVINFSPSEISSVMNRPIQQIANIKKRIGEKMFGANLTRNELRKALLNLLRDSIS